MLDKKVRNFFDAAKANKEFCDAIYLADGDTVPGFFSRDVDKLVFIAGYYGYLVGKYGAQHWKEHAGI